MAASTPGLSPRQRSTISRLRLGAQGLAPECGPATMTRSASTPDEVVAALGMIQAQDLPQGCWGIGARLPGAGLTEIHDALARGSIIRTWGARGTLMLIVPRLYRTLLAVTGARMESQMRATRAAEAIIDAEIDALADVARARCGREGATRAQLLAAFGAAGSSIAGQRGYHLIVAVALRGAIVQGPMEPGSSTRQLFMEASEWVKEPDATLDPDQALDELVRIYFASHGPATIADCAWWLGLPLTPVRLAVQRAADTLASVELGSRRFFFAPSHRDRWETPPGARSVVALPGFDEFILGYKDRTATLAPEFAEVVTPGKNGLFRRTVAAGGETIGTWEVESKGTTRVARFVPFSGITVSAARHGAIESRMNDYLRFRDS